MDKGNITADQAATISNGFKIESIRMRDGDTNTIFLDKPNWSAEVANVNDAGEIEVHLPAIMLKSKSIGRMIVFSS